MITATQQEFLALFASYRDVFYPRTNLARSEEIRAAAALHAMNHVLR